MYNETYEPQDVSGQKFLKHKNYTVKKHKVTLTIRIMIVTH